MDHTSRTVKHSSIIEIRGINPYVLVSAARATKLKAGWRKPMPVRVRVNDQPKTPWRINMMPTGAGSFYLYLHGEVRKASDTKVGDRVRVEISFDSDYKGGPQPMPEWFRKPLQKSAAAKKAWSALIPSRQKEMLHYLTHLKSPEARQRNLERALRVLVGERKRFLARDWEKGK